MRKLWLKLKSLFGHRDLTKGSPMKNILLFLVPVLLSTVFQQLFQITDAAIIGQALTQESVAGVNASSSVNYIVLNLGIGSATGFSVLLSKNVGANNVLEAKRSFLTQCILCIAVSAFIAAVGIPMIPVFLKMMNIVQGSGDPSMELEFQEARTYMTFLFGGAVLTVFYNMAFANLRAKGDSFAPFMFLAFGVVLNVCLDLLFVRTFRWGIAGSAGATLLSQGISAALSLIYGIRKYEEFRIDFKNAKPTWKGILEHAKNGLPLGFQFSILGIGIIAMTSGVVAFDIYENGTTVAGLPAQIGYAAGCKVINFLFAPLEALCATMISFISQNYGAKRFDRVKQGIKSGLILCLILSALSNAIGLPLLIGGAYQYLFFSPEKISEASIHYGNVYLGMSIPLLFILGCLFVFRGVLQGLEKPLFAFLGGVTELLIRIFVCAALPKIIFGTISASSPEAAYFIVASGDWTAWLGGAITMMIPAIYFTRKYLKSLQNTAA